MSVAQTNTNGVSFVLNNLQATGVSNIGANTNSVPTIPNLLGLDYQSAAFMTGRQPGGVAFRGQPQTVFASPSNANAAAILVDAFESSVARLGYTKSGAFYLALNGTTAVTVPLTNTQTNTNGYWGDTTFATANVLLFRNVSGIDGNPNASISINGSGTNGHKMGLTTNSQITLDGNGSVFWNQSVNGFTVNAANANITFTPTNTGAFVCVIAGS
jgi:hypothetical protein